MITQEMLKEMGIQLIGLRERERELLAELEKVRTNIGRQEGAVMLAEHLLQQAQAGAPAPRTNGNTTAAEAAAK